MVFEIATVSVKVKINTKLKNKVCYDILFLCMC